MLFWDRKNVGIASGLCFWKRRKNVLYVPFLTTRESPVLSSPGNAPPASSTPNPP